MRVQRAKEAGGKEFQHKLSVEMACVKRPVTVSFKETDGQSICAWFASIVLIMASFSVWDQGDSR